MRRILLATAATLACGVAQAGTLTLDYVATRSACGDENPKNCGYSGFSSPMQFIFDVSLLSPVFSFAEDTTSSGVTNPYGATLLSRPDGHLGGYLDRIYEIALSATGVSVTGLMSDFDDITFFTADHVLESHNQGQYLYQEFGSWTASYLPSGSGDGDPFTVGVANVPLPASLPLLAGALGLLGWSRFRSRA